MRTRYLAISAVSLAVALSACGSGSGSSNPPSLNEALQAGSCHQDATTSAYSNSFADASKLSSITPLGAMSRTHVTPIDHIYVNYPPVEGDPMAPSGLPAGTYNITSPADGWIVNVQDFKATNEYPYPDYRVVIEHSCNLYSVFIHVGELQGAAKAAMGKESWKGSIPVKAGEVIADDSANPGFDFSTFDATKNVSFINPSSYASQDSWKIHTVNPLDYMPADVKTQLEAKSLRSVAPVGGTIEYDKAGTAQGSWFVKDTNGYTGKGGNAANYSSTGDGVSHGYWDTHLAMAPNNIDPKAFIYSVGDWAGCPCQFMSVGNIDPASITASTKPTVLELVRGTAVNPDGSVMDENRPVKGFSLKASNKIEGLLAIQVNEDGTMTVQKMPGAKSKAEFTGFTKEALTYVR